jgi:hypothetical protein
VERIREGGDPFGFGSIKDGLASFKVFGGGKGLFHTIEQLVGLLYGGIVQRFIIVEDCGRGLVQEHPVLRLGRQHHVLPALPP